MHLKIKKAISENQPVVISMHVYPSFHNSKEVWNGSTIGEQGHHAMCVVGYDDDKYAPLYNTLITSLRKAIEMESD